jgi:hypothetical protein
MANPAALCALIPGKKKKAVNVRSGPQIGGCQRQTLPNS